MQSPAVQERQGEPLHVAIVMRGETGGIEGMLEGEFRAQEVDLLLQVAFAVVSLVEFDGDELVPDAVVEGLGSATVGCYEFVSGVLGDRGVGLPVIASAEVGDGDVGSVEVHLCWRDVETRDSTRR